MSRLLIVIACCVACATSDVAAASHSPSGEGGRDFATGAGTNQFMIAVGDARFRFAVSSDPLGLRPLGGAAASGDPDGLGPMGSFTAAGEVTCLRVEGNRAAFKWRFTEATGSAAPFAGVEAFVEDNGHARGGAPVDRAVLGVPQPAATFEPAAHVCEDPDLVAGYDALETGSITVHDADPADGLGGCRLAGTARFTPALRSEAQPFTYTLDGALSECAGTSPRAPARGAVSVGRRRARIQGVTFDQPLPVAEGGCRSATAKGTMWVVWSDGGVSIVDYTTTGVAATLSLTGEVVRRRTVRGADGRRHVIRSTRHRGRSVRADLLTRPDDATACSGAGVRSSALDGPLTLG